MSIYRNAVWFIKGMKEYTKNGYLSASRYFKPGELDVDVTGKSFMITGANSGIGKCAALAIAKRGGTVHMVCRDPTRGEDARKEVMESTGNQNVYLHKLDMSKPKDVATFAREFESSGKPLDVLVNNAGCMAHLREETEDGLEKNFATNTLGVHILTTCLIPVLSKAEKPRVVIVTSGGMLVQKLNVKDIQLENMKPFDGTMAYAQNKRQQVVMTEMYAQKYPNIHFSCMHPGWADTPAVQTAMPDFYNKMRDRLRTPEQGADTLIWLAIAKDINDRPNGLFFQDREPAPTHLPLAWSKSTPQEKEQLMTLLDGIAEKFR